MAKKLFLTEILSHLKTLDTFEERVAFFQHQRTPALEQLCYYSFGEGFKFDVEIPTDYKPLNVPMGMGDVNLSAELRRFYIFTTTSPADAKRKRLLLLGLLNNLPPEEATLVTDILSGKIRTKYQNFTHQLVSTVYPQIPIKEVVENKVETVEEKPVEVEKVVAVVEKKVVKKEKPKQKVKAKKCPNCPHYMSSHGPDGCKKCDCKG